MLYEKLKKVLKTLLPKKFLAGQKPGLRRLVYLFYKGTDFECPVCGSKLRRFIQLKTGDNLCPACGSLDRHRRLWMLLQVWLAREICILDFSPPYCLYQKLKTLPQVKYTSTDFSGEFMAAEKFDITQLPVQNKSYDLIICYHVLEHIEDDSKAMNEMYRVLKENGACVIQTPFKEGDIYENTSAITPTERKEHFGQEDHTRIYSVNGLSNRLENAGFLVESLQFIEPEKNYYGLQREETVLVATKIR